MCIRDSACVIITLLDAVGGPQGADFSQGVAAPLLPLRTAPAEAADIYCYGDRRRSVTLLGEVSIIGRDHSGLVCWCVQ